MRTIRQAAIAGFLATLLVASFLGCDSGDATPAMTGEVPDSATSEPKEAAASGPSDGQVKQADASAAETSDDDDAGPLSGACTSYCVQVMDVCKGINVQYPSIGACFNACRYFPEGEPGDATENSLVCRAFHTLVGSTSPQDADGHCLHSGIYGYGGCGTPCDPFCAIAMGWCGKSASGAPFPNMAACQDACATWTDAPGPTMVGVLYSADGPATGNTRDCRQFHLTTSLRSAADRDVHCPLAAASSTACK